MFEQKVKELLPLDGKKRKNSVGEPSINKKAKEVKNGKEEEDAQLAYDVLCIQPSEGFVKTKRCFVSTKSKK